MKRRKQIATKLSRRALHQAPQEEQEEDGDAAAAAPTRGRGHGRDRGAVRGAARTPGEEDQSREGTRAHQVPARERSAPIVLSEAEKEDIVEWIQANECLYNKGHPTRTVDISFSCELGITQKALMTWWQNQRTKYGRLARSVGASGSGRKEDSEQEKWCRRSFQFLGRFVARTLVRSGVDLQARMRQRYPEMAQPETETQTETQAVTMWSLRSQSFQICASYLNRIQGSRRLPKWNL